MPKANFCFISLGCGEKIGVEIVLPQRRKTSGVENIIEE